MSELLLGARSGCRTRGLFCGPWNTAPHLVRIGEAGAPVPQWQLDRVAAEVLSLLAHTHIQLCNQRSVGS